jgi:hypothetical protein
VELAGSIRQGHFPYPPRHTDGFSAASFYLQESEIEPEVVPMRL